MDGEAVLTAEQFRDKLYNKLQNQGYIDDLKAQLRHKLVQELQNGPAIVPVKPTLKTAEESLMYKAANSLVCDHLRRNDFDYSYSVFLPESGTVHEQVMSVRDLLHLLRINPQSKLYKNLAQNITEYDKKGFLWQLLTEIASLHGYADNDSGVQTEQIPLYQSASLDDKLNRIDRLYSNRLEENQQTGRWATEERILLYQKQVEERAKMESKLEISRFKEHELARVRVEERDRCRRELEETRRELERTYQLKVEALSDRERNMTERLQKQQESQEKELYSQRQSILEELENLRQRESQLRREKEVNERERKLNDERIRAIDEQLKKRENIVQISETEFNSRIEEERKRYQLDEKARYVHKEKELELQATKNQDDLSAIEREKESLRSVREELHEKAAKLKELEMVDYKYIKEENAVLRKELETLKHRLSEVSNDLERERHKRDLAICDMMRQSNQPSADVILLKGEVEKARTSVNQEKLMVQRDHSQLQKRLYDEICQNKQLLEKFEEHTQAQKEMNQEISDLRLQLAEHKKALSNGVNRRNNGADDDSDADSQKTNDGYFDTPLKKKNPAPELRLVGGYKNGYNDSADSGTDDFIAETRRRLREMEREAETLETSYRKFQGRVTESDFGWPSESMKNTAARYQVVFTDDPVRSLINKNRDDAALSSPLQSIFNKRPSSPPKKSPRTPRSPRRSSPKSTFSTTKEKTLEDYKGGIKDQSPQLPSLSLSTVKTSSQETATPPSQALEVKGTKQLTMADLEMRPGSPSLVIFPGSQTTETNSHNDGTNNGTLEQTNDLSKPSPGYSRDIVIEETPSKDGHISFYADSEKQTIAETPVSNMETTLKDDHAASVEKPALNLDQSWNAPSPIAERRSSPPAAAAINLDQSWKPTASYDMQKEVETQQEEEERKRREAEDREWEARQQKRDSWRKKRNSTEIEPENDVETKKIESKIESNNNEPNDDLKIDPVMQQYMALIQKQKEDAKNEPPKEPDVVEGSHSEQEVSGLDDAAPKSPGLESDDFDW
ncbi:centriole and centriolar satellite protein OFD1-like isoform X2 [Tubulanus polymorphus]|uniref:centriole and centriolar satellite protein OFD1-like isoform X2 n=1 Tax=Tubulanus polymorphus TaxID=672921 RepID=UPI003DA4A231